MNLLKNQCYKNKTSSSYKVLCSQHTNIFGYQLAFICEESKLFGFTEYENIWLQEFQIKESLFSKNQYYTSFNQKLEGHNYEISVLEYNSSLKLLVSANFEEMKLWQKDNQKQWKNKQTLMISLTKRLIIISDKLNQIIYSPCRKISVLQNIDKENIKFSQIQLIKQQENLIKSFNLNEQQDLLFVEQYDFEILILRVQEQKWHKIQRLTNIKDCIFIGVKKFFFNYYSQDIVNLQYKVFALNKNNNQFEIIHEKEIDSNEQTLDETSFFTVFQTTKCCKVYHSSSKGIITYRNTIQNFERVLAVSQKGLFIVRLNFQASQLNIYINTQNT
ncbi:unnamed protein product [Paramecium primaurelia]|uniref:Uncharacterized protein n=1 Tax=Paramecium primaurelia TaxID=5886 RepID=A0A8S1M796_PARPR|nr:unnamed protein product [Paramecium primaurelia]